MPLGKCKMCLNQEMLVSSHLMPRLLYDYCRKGEHRPIRVGDGVVIPTDRQTQDYLLCQDCEDVLNKRGEGWVAGKLATFDGKFPLYDLLTKVSPVLDEDGMAVNDPYEGVRQEWRTHFFHVPGILFMMTLGKTVTEDIRSLAINSVGNPINISEVLTGDFEKLLAKSMQGSRQTDAYLRAKAKAESDRKSKQ